MKRASAARSSDMDLFSDANWYDQLYLQGKTLVLPGPEERKESDKGTTVANPRRVELQRECLDQILSLSRLQLCDFSALRSCMDDLAGRTVMVGLNASIVRGKLEHLLSIEKQLLRTPNISELDAASIHAACAHVAASFYSNVLIEKGIRAPRADGRRDLGLTVVELGGISYKLNSTHRCNLLWHGAVALRYTYAGSAEYMDVAGVAMLRSAKLDAAEPLAYAMVEWRAEAENILETYVEDQAELLMIKKYVLDLLAVGLDHEDAISQSKATIKYLLAHTKQVNSSKCNARWYNVGVMERHRILKLDDEYNMHGELLDHFDAAWEGDNCLAMRAGKSDKVMVGLQCSRCLWSRVNPIEVYFERLADIPPHLRGTSVNNLTCPSADWTLFLPTSVVFALLDAYVSRYVRGAPNKASTAHRTRAAVDDGQSSRPMATLYVSDSQGAVYARDESDEDASKIFAAERRSTLISVAKRDELIARQGAFLRDLLQLFPYELRYNLAIQSSMLLCPAPDTPAPD